LQVQSELTQPNTGHPNRTDLHPRISAARGIARASAFDDESFDTHRTRQNVEPLARFVEVISDRGQLKWRRPGARKLLEALSAYGAALRAQIDSSARQQVERGVGGR
jgi:hypothetical protein